MDSYDYCSTCGKLVPTGVPCKYCAPAANQHGLANALPIQYSPDFQTPAPVASATSPTMVIIIVLELLIGLFWLTLGGLQLWAATTGVGILAAVGIWNLFNGALGLTFINEVVRQRPQAARRIVIQSLVGAGWALIAGLWLQAWIQFLVLPLYIALGVMIWTNSTHFAEKAAPDRAPVWSARPPVPQVASWGQAQPRFPASGKTPAPAADVRGGHDHGVAVVERAMTGARAAYCPKCGTAVMPGAAFCHACGEATVALSR